MAVAASVLKYVFHILLGCGVCSKNRLFATIEEIMLAPGVRQLAGAQPSAVGQKAAQMQALQASGNMPWLLQERWTLLRCQVVRLCSQPGIQ